MKIGSVVKTIVHLEHDPRYYFTIVPIILRHVSASTWCNYALNRVTCSLSFSHKSISSFNLSDPSRYSDTDVNYRPSLRIRTTSIRNMNTSPRLPTNYDKITRIQRTNLFLRRRFTIIVLRSSFTCFFELGTKLHLLATCLCVDAYLRFKQDLIDPQLRYRSRIRVGNLRQLYRDTLREFRELLFRSLSFVGSSLQFRLSELVQIANRTIMIVRRAVIQFHRLQARG